MPALSRFSGAKVWSSVLQTFTTNVAATLTFDTVIYDTDGYFSAAQPTRLTVPFDGFYRITASQDWVASAANSMRRQIISRNAAATTEAIQGHFAPTTNSKAGSISVSVTVYAIKGDYFVTSALQDTGGNLNNTPSAPYSPGFEIEYLGTP